MSSPSTNNPELVYVYGFTASAAALLTDSAAVEPDASVHRIEVGDVCALITKVPAATYGEAELAMHVRDPEWIATRAVAHDQVLRGAAELGPVLPLRLCAIYRDEARVSALLRHNRSAIVEELRRVAGHREWGIKVYVDPNALTASGEAAEKLGGMRAELEKATPGHAHFARRRVEQLERATRDGAADELAAEVHALLSKTSTDSVRLEPQAPAVSGRDKPQILHAAYLVNDRGREGFDAALARIGERAGVDAQRTGPWPPFHFTRIQLAPPAE